MLQESIINEYPPNLQACKQKKYAIAGNKVDVADFELRNLTTGSLFGFDRSLLTHSRKNDNVYEESVHRIELYFK